MSDAGTVLPAGNTTPAPAPSLKRLPSEVAATLSAQVPNGWSATTNVILLLITVAGMVAVFWKLGLAKRKEALGMPANSVRALLALIVLIMLATLGAQFFNAMSNPAVEVATFTDVKASDIENIKSTEFTAIVLSRSSKTDLVTGKVFRAGSTPAAQDLAKTISSALLTLLTAIISFYFGTQATREGARSITDANPQPGQPQPSDGPPDVEASAAKAMADGIQRKLAELGQDPIKPLNDALAGAKSEVAEKLRHDLDAARTALENAKTAVAACLTHANEAATAAADAAASSSDPAKLKDATARAQKARAAAGKDSHDFEHALAAFKTAQNKILATTAKG